MLCLTKKFKWWKFQCQNNQGEETWGAVGWVQKSLWGSVKSPHKGPCVPRGQAGLTSQMVKPRPPGILGKLKLLAMGLYAAAQETAGF